MINTTLMVKFKDDVREKSFILGCCLPLIIMLYCNSNNGQVIITATVLYFVPITCRSDL